MLRFLIVAKYTLVLFFIVYSNVSKTFHNFDLSFCIMRKMYINILVLLFFIITFLLTTTATTTTLLTIINFYSPKHGICLCVSLLSSKPPRDIILLYLEEMMWSNFTQPLQFIPDEYTLTKYLLLGIIKLFYNSYFGHT